MFLAEPRKTGMNFHHHLPVDNSLRQFALAGLAKYRHGASSLGSDKEKGVERPVDLVGRLPRFG